MRVGQANWSRWGRIIHHRVTVPSYLPYPAIPFVPSPALLLLQREGRDGEGCRKGECNRGGEGGWRQMVAASSNERRSKQANRQCSSWSHGTTRASLRSPSLPLSLSLILSLSRLARYRCSFSQCLHLPLLACIRLFCNELLYLNRRTLAFSCLISRYLTQRFRELLRRTERVVLLNGGISALLYRRLPLTLRMLLYTAHLHTLPNH